jgi:hypothetical protein
MEWDDFRSPIVRYVLERRCRSGGFCFYKLEEPSGSDTWFALSILDILQVRLEDAATVAYLKGTQRHDGSYDSVYLSYFAIKSLALLGEIPSLDPRPYVMLNLERYRFNVKRLPAEVISMFKRISCLVELYGALDMDNHGPLRDNMVDFILGFQNEDGGFGYLRSTLHETSKALEMLQRLGCSLDGLGAESFIGRCETPITGFTDIPHTSLGYLEFVHAGVLASHLLARRPQYTKQCAEFVLNCQNRNGGFSRTPHGGIATLENTWHGIHALTILSRWSS